MSKKRADAVEKEEKCFRNSKIVFDGIFLSINSHHLKNKSFLGYVEKWSSKKSYPIKNVFISVAR